MQHVWIQARWTQPLLLLLHDIDDDDDDDVDGGGVDDGDSDVGGGTAPKHCCSRAAVRASMQASDAGSCILAAEHHNTLFQFSGLPPMCKDSTRVHNFQGSNILESTISWTRTP
eukprot:scaffold168673_cov20-Tisochrysis_lutea.AAC.2